MGEIVRQMRDLGRAEVQEFNVRNAQICSDNLSMLDNEWAEIQKANDNLAPEKLRVGMSINLPASSGKVAKSFDRNFTTCSTSLSRWCWRSERSKEAWWRVARSCQSCRPARCSWSKLVRTGS